MRAFDEDYYLSQYPDVRIAIKKGLFRNALHHFEEIGQREGRSAVPPSLKPEPASGPRAAEERALRLPGKIETLVANGDGLLFCNGWIDDRAAPISQVSVRGAGKTTHVLAPAILRYRRDDVTTALDAHDSHAFGIAFVVQTPAPAGGTYELRFRSGEAAQAVGIEAARRPDFELLWTVLSFVHLLNTAFLDFPAAARFCRLIRNPLDALYRTVLDGSRAVAATDGFGQQPPRVSFLTVVYERAPFLPLFGHWLRRAAPVAELIVVNNTKTMHEELAHLLHKFHYMYGLRSQLVSLQGNCGFGAANNVGVPLASSKNVVLINPDCFLDEASLPWLLDHPFAAGRLRGAALRYENGSLMHSGMCFDVDPLAGSLAGPLGGRSEAADPWASHILRVDHLSKGAPREAMVRQGDLDVPAVTGALMCFRRGDFERNGGFDERYMFGHYEDADLCLRWGRARGGRVVVDTRIQGIHLEGRGGSGAPPAINGGKLFNRVRFHDTWAAQLAGTPAALREQGAALIAAHAAAMAGAGTAGPGAEG